MVGQDSALSAAPKHNHYVKLFFFLSFCGMVLTHSGGGSDGVPGVARKSF
jgi:hypothetical protein